MIYEHQEPVYTFSCEIPFDTFLKQVRSLKPLEGYALFVASMGSGSDAYTQICFHQSPTILTSSESYDEIPPRSGVPCTISIGGTYDGNDIVSEFSMSGQESIALDIKKSLDEMLEPLSLPLSCLTQMIRILFHT